MTTRAEALATLDRGHREIMVELARLPSEHMATTGIGGGEWSPKDLLGHLALWHEIALRTIEEFKAGEQPWIVGVFSGPGPGPNDEELAARAGWSLDRARAAHDDSSAIVRSSIETMSDAEWNRPVEGGPDEPATLGGLLGAVLGMDRLPFGHAFAHLAELSAFVEAHRGESTT